jgi:hypothetical protein
MPRSICSDAIIPFLLLFQDPNSGAQPEAAEGEKGQIVVKSHHGCRRLARHGAP